MTIRYRHVWSMTAALLSVAAATAWAQTETPERPPRQAPADQCYSGGPASPPGPPAREPQGRTPSDQLSQSGGIVCPPAEVDPNMTKPAPNVGRTPVIPPPGGPGSPVQPK
ncbi:MAG: hypothetical protein ACM30I_03710 [Gemmatimonas sp.]